MAHPKNFFGGAPMIACLPTVVCVITLRSKYTLWEKKRRVTTFPFSHFDSLIVLIYLRHGYVMNVQFNGVNCVALYFALLTSMASQTKLSAK